MSQHALPLAGVPSKPIDRDSTHSTYTFPQIVLLWAATALPMIALAWIAAPALIPASPFPAVITYGLALLPGLIWQCALALWLIRREEGSLRWAVIRERIGLVAPRHPRTGQARRRLLWRALPRFVILLLLFLLEMTAVFILMFLALRFSFIPSTLLEGIRGYMQPLDLINPAMAGRWDMLILVMLGWAFGAFCAEELFYRGVLLPRMAGRGWLANAALFAASHLYRPWAIPFRLLEGILIARPARRLRSLWMAILARSAEGVILLGLLIGAVSLPGVEPIPADVEFPTIERRPQPLGWVRGALGAAPHYQGGGNPFTVDLRHYDLTRLDLSGSLYDLEYAVFDTATRWPASDRMPDGFDPAAILEMGKNPGLGVRSLHERGITGQGVGIAILDQALLVDHQEYADRLMWYEDMAPFSLTTAEMHGPSVSSIALGETVGVAPGANLYYINAQSSMLAIGSMHYFAAGVRRVMELNEHLPPEGQIRVISISTGWPDFMPGSAEMVQAVEDAEASGILVLHVGSNGLRGLGRHPNADPDDFASYEPGLFWEPTFYGGQIEPAELYVPMDSRTTAGPGGTDEYFFGRIGGWSWTVPYLAGVYALAAQVDPDITPDQFWALAYETGRSTEIEHEGLTYTLGTILDPAALIERIMDDADR